MTSTRAARRVLWVVALISLPAPIVLLGPGRVPPAQLAELGAAAVAVGLAEGFSNVVAWAAVIFLGQALVWALLALALSAALARCPRPVRAAALAAAALWMVVACALPVYRTPYHARHPAPTLLEVYR